MSNADCGAWTGSIKSHTDYSFTFMSRFWQQGLYLNGYLLAHRRRDNRTPWIWLLRSPCNLIFQVTKDDMYSTIMQIVPPLTK